MRLKLRVKMLVADRGGIGGLNVGQDSGISE